MSVRGAKCREARASCMDVVDEEKDSCDNCHHRDFSVDPSIFCNKTSLICLEVLSTQCISEIDLSYCGSNHPFHPWWFVIFNTLR